MKKLITILFTTLSFYTYAQNSFPTSNAIWNEEYQISPHGFHLYGLKGETMINDMLYQKLYILNDTTLDCINEQSQPYGYMRQLDQKVYFQPYYWEYPDIDILLYDFGASVGDIVWHGEDYSIIQKIEIENDRRIFYIEKNIGLPDIWYEGIGSYRGLFGSIEPIPLFNNFPNKLVCFKHNDIVEFLDNPKCDKCFCTSNSIDDLMLEKINIFPNPTDGILMIHSDNELINNIEVMDITGKMMDKQIVNAEKFELNISALPPANYLIKIITNNSTHIQKIIKK